MPLDFNDIAPIVLFMLQQSPVKVFLADLCANAYCTIPTLPNLHCNSVSFTTNRIEDIEDCFTLAYNGYASVKMLTIKTNHYTCTLNLAKSRATLKTRIVGVVEGFRDIVNQVPGLHLVTIIR
jgi:hypothetical protein